MKKITLYFIRFLVVLLTFQGAITAVLLQAPAAKAATPPEVVINEVMWMGSSVSSHDQWLELYNASGSAISLAGMSLSNITSDGTSFQFDNSASIAKDGYLILGPSSGGPTMLARAVDVQVPNFQLSASCQTITLSQISATVTGSIVDQMGCNGTSYLAGDAATHRSMERKVSPIAWTNGLVASAWQTSVQQMNIITPAVTSDYASPWAANAVAPTPGTVRDGSNLDADITTNNASYTANWDKFTDPEDKIDPSGNDIASYQLSLSTSSACDTFVAGISSSIGGTNTTQTIFFPTPLSDGRYYGCVLATNKQGQQSFGVSDGFIVDAGSLISNFALTNGSPADGSHLTASWQTQNYAGTPTNLIDHYSVTLTDASNVSTSYTVAGNQQTDVIGGLTNNTAYTATIVAVDNNGNQSQVYSTSGPTTTQETIPPVLDPTKIVVNQNAPGTLDSVDGLAGASSEAGTAYLYSQDPTSLTGAALLAAQIGNPEGLAADLSFSPMAIGDNQYGAVWLRVVNASNIASAALELTNDIVAPNAPTLTNLTASCPSDCQVTLNWHDNGPDTLAYQVGYTLQGGSQQLSLRVTTPTMTLTLPSGDAYDFVVYAIDAAGNVSTPSNDFHVELTKGVVTTINLSNGSPVTTTSALSGAAETNNTPASAALFTPTQVQAAAPADGTTTSSTPKVAAQKTSNSSWLKILGIILLLLIIAAGFYLLSRSFDDDEDGQKPAVKAAAIKPAESKTGPKPKRSTKKRKP